MVTLADIQAARARIGSTIYYSPCAYSETVSRMTGARVLLKLDNLQMTGSFKERGALNKLLSLTPTERQQGVIAASAGNHGLAVALKESGFQGRVIGVQAERIPGMKAALAAGEPTPIPRASTIADGIAVRRVGDQTLPLTRRYVDHIVTVSELEIAQAILVFLETEKTVVEGAAATPLAALLHRPLGLAGKTVVLVVSGGNIDMNVVARVIEKGLVQEGRLVRISLIVPDRPGALARVSTLVADQRANILEIMHSRGFSRAEIGESEITLTLETSGPQHITEVLVALRTAGYQVFEEQPGPA